MGFALSNTRLQPGAAQMRSAETVSTVLGTCAVCLLVKPFKRLDRVFYRSAPG
jgi:hypothetical protein